MSYTRESIIKEVDDFLTPTKIANLYEQEKILNRIGSTSDSKEKYTEVIAARLLSDLSVFKKIEHIARAGSYNAGHVWKPIDPASPRTEEQTARSMMDKTYDYIGKIMDYQTPLKNVQSDAAGKIDLLSWNEAKGCAYILEFKSPDSTETLLRCVLEIETYSRIVDSEKLLRDFGHEGSTLRKAALVYDDSRPHSDFMDDKNVKKLMKALGVDLFVLDKHGERVVEAHYYEKLEK